ncbi:MULTISPECIES: hypothetical protein [Pseudomonadati]|uniref:Uncharacterized protein n=1 Tax=Shewanella aestuarii TaxID=1028752 RepID=A0ABT0KZ56_9GAMM|nr:hypothetical protein [Shewanella aestuarii]MCL1116530.1 hypothetical protein [Shewanella aestuarii]GGN71970.1 periplasmic protein [Shewanella aestuarii]
MQYLILIISLIFSSAAVADRPAIKVGDTLVLISLLDQFEKPLNVTAETKVLLFSRDMDGGEIIQAAFADTPDDQRPENLVYVADISGMPSLIAKYVAVPKMQDYPFTLGLDREGEITAAFPLVKGQATIIKLNDLKIQSIEFAQDAKMLKLQW